MRRATVLAGRPTSRWRGGMSVPVELNSKHPFQINEIFTGHGKLCKFPAAFQSAGILHTPVVAGLPNNRRRAVESFALYHATISRGAGTRVGEFKGARVKKKKRKRSLV